MGGGFALAGQVSDLLDRLYDRLDDAADAEGVTKARRVGRGGVGEGGGRLRNGLTAVCVCVKGS